MATNKNQKNKTISIYHYKTRYQRDSEQFNSEVEDNSRKIEEADIRPEDKLPDKRPKKTSSSVSLGYA